jgi:hypothetical protein
MKNKRAAMEMSVGTLVTIVLLMAVLGLGIVLIGNIFNTATGSVGVIDDKIMGELNDLFAEQGADVVVRLGADRLAKIPQDSYDFGIAIGAQTPDGSATDRSRLQYKLKLDDSEQKNCVALLGGESYVEDLIRQKIGRNRWINFDQFDGPSAGARISFDIPKAITKCTQKVLIDVRDTDDSDRIFAGTFFKFQII